MPNPYVRETGRVEDFDGRRLVVGVDYDLVTVGDYRLSASQVAEFTDQLAAARQEAARLGTETELAEAREAGADD